MQKEQILSQLLQNADSDGKAQFNFSRDLSTQHLERKILKELESEGYIQLSSGALGYAIYRIL